MTWEDKELLLKDICARFPYKLVCKVKYRENGEYKTSNMVLDGIFRDNAYFISQNGTVYSGDYKPYLFPLSSMTEEQKYEFYLRFIVKDCDCVFDYFKFCLDNGKWHKLLTSLLAVEEIIDWFNKNHFDYRGLIEKGLALDATGKNIY